MKLTETLKFLSPAIEKKNKILPVLEHVKITQGYAIAYNGMLAMAAPISLPLECCPNGSLLEQAVKSFGDEFSAIQKPNGDLYFKSAKFSVTIPCTTDEFPMPDFQGAPILQGGGFVDKLKKLVQFTARDDQNPWQAGVLLRDGKAVATCGHTLAFCDVNIPAATDLLIPLDAVEAMIEIGEEPEYMAKGENRFVVVYSGGRFLSSPLIHTSWPNITKIIAPMTVFPIPEGLFKAIKSIEPFGIGAMKNQFFMFDGKVSSTRNGSGACAEVAGLAGGWEWNHASTKLLERHARLLNMGQKLGAWKGEGIAGRFQLRPAQEVRS